MQKRKMSDCSDIFSYKAKREGDIGIVCVQIKKCRSTRDEKKLMWCYSLIGIISQLFLALTRKRPVLQQKDERKINGGYGCVEHKKGSALAPLK